jgi:hypothetical protein
MANIYPTEQDLRLALQSRVNEFSRLTGMSASAIGVAAVNNGAVIGSILDGNDFLASTHRRLMEWMERNEPQPGVIATPDRFEVLQPETPQRIKDLRASIVYRPPRGGKPRRKEREGEWMTRGPRLVVGLPTYALRDWPYHAEQGFVFARGVNVARIILADGGTPLVKPRARSSGGAFYFGYMPALGGTVQQKEWVPFRRLEPEQAGGAVIEIDAPDWLRAAS